MTVSAPGPGEYDVSFIISTRNRPDVLVACIRACLAQTGISFEILVYDDASDEDMRPLLAREFGDRVKVTRLEENLGQPAVRSRALREATAEYVVQLDDDTLLFDAECAKRAVELLRENERIAAVPLRYYERRKRSNSGRAGERTNGWRDEQRSTFVGCAVVLRRSAAIQCGCYPEWVYREHEERFLSVRLLDGGYDIVLSGPPSAVHLVSPIRDHTAISWYGIRNALLFDWICIPQPYTVPFLVKDIVRLFAYRLSLRNVCVKCAAMLWGLSAIIQKRALRRAVRRSTFRRFRSLPRHGALPLPAEWDTSLLVDRGIVQARNELAEYLS